MSNNPLFDGEGIEFAHLQRLGQQRQTAEVKRLLEEQARQRRGVCACPHCGGGIPQIGVSVCMHCRRSLHWHNGFCAGTTEEAQSLARQSAEQGARKLERRKRKLEREAAYQASPEAQRERARTQVVGWMTVLSSVPILVGGLLFIDPSFAAEASKPGHGRFVGLCFFLTGLLMSGLTGLVYRWMK